MSIHPYNKQYIIRYINTNLKIRLAIQNENQLYFISIFIYTFIKVKLTEREKEMASPKPNRTISADFLIWLQSIRNPSPKAKQDFLLIKPPKAHPKIRKITLHFATRIGEIITDMPYICETEI